MCTGLLAPRKCKFHNTNIIMFLFRYLYKRRAQGKVVTANPLEFYRDMFDTRDNQKVTLPRIYWVLHHRKGDKRWKLNKQIKKLPQLSFRMSNISLNRNMRNGNYLALIYTIYRMTTYASNLPPLCYQYQIVWLQEFNATCRETKKRTRKIRLDRDTKQF